IATVEYQLNGITYHREAFVSEPDQSIVIRFWASQPGAISFVAALDRPERFATAPVGRNGLLMTGQLHNGTDGKGMKYAARLRVINQGGVVSIENNAVSVKGANEVLLLITAATDYMGFAGRKTPDPFAASAKDLA